ncbi:MAG: DUF748 domain-containing protein, partial [Methylococcaceae bacterium]|nr:DUF748 domain-containing protein [Methylococcaceae bacterium]
GFIKLAGDSVIKPFSAKVAVDAKGIALENFQVYLEKFIRLDIIDGKLNIDGKAVLNMLEKDQLDVTFKGNTGIVNLLAKDQLRKEKDQKKVWLKFLFLHYEELILIWTRRNWCWTLLQQMMLNYRHG